MRPTGTRSRPSTNPENDGGHLQVKRTRSSPQLLPVVVVVIVGARFVYALSTARQWRLSTGTWRWRTSTRRGLLEVTGGETVGDRTTASVTGRRRSREIVIKWHHFASGGGGGTRRRRRLNEMCAQHQNRWRSQPHNDNIIPSAYRRDCARCIQVQ